MSFTQAELDAIAAADAEIEADFCLTPEEIAAARDRDERAIFERVCDKRTRAAPKSLEEKERDFQKFKAARKKPLTDKDRERAKAYYHAHKEYYKARRLAYYQANRERFLAYAREYFQAHKSECQAKSAKRRRERYHSDPEYAERMREQSRRKSAKNYLAHRDERLAYQKAYCEAHKEEIRAYQAAYRRKRKKAKEAAE